MPRDVSLSDSKCWRNSSTHRNDVRQFLRLSLAKLLQIHLDVRSVVAVDDGGQALQHHNHRRVVLHAQRRHQKHQVADVRTHVHGRRLAERVQRLVVTKYPRASVLDGPIFCFADFFFAFDLIFFFRVNMSYYPELTGPRD